MAPGNNKRAYFEIIFVYILYKMGYKRYSLYGLRMNCLIIFRLYLLYNIIVYSL